MKQKFYEEDLGQNFVNWFEALKGKVSKTLPKFYIPILFPLYRKRTVGSQNIFLWF